MGAVGVDAAGQLEGGRIEFKDGYSAEAIGIGIEYLVVVNLVALAEDPFAVGLQIGLRGLALDLVAQDLLALVGVRNVGLIKNE